MEFKKYSDGDWQLRVWKLQLNWTAYAKDYPTLPYGLRVWFNGRCVADNWLGSKSAKLKNQVCGFKKKTTLERMHHD